MKGGRMDDRKEGKKKEPDREGREARSEGRRSRGSARRCVGCSKKISRALGSSVSVLWDVARNINYRDSMQQRTTALSCFVSQD